MAGAGPNIKAGHLGVATVLALSLAACTAQPQAAHRVAPTANPSPAATRTTTPRPLAALPAGVVAHGSRALPLVALTFDSNLTPFMERELDRGTVRSFDNTAEIGELVRLRVPATFFLSGLWMQRYPGTTRQLGRVPFFEIGSHSYSHRGFAPHCYELGLLPVGQRAADIVASEAVLARYVRRPTRLFRFPGGCYDPASLRAARAAHVIVVQYDVASGDAFGQSVQGIVRHTLSSVRNGSIVVMHITGGNTAPLSAAALPAVVRGLRSRGFQLVTVSRLLAGLRS